VKRAGRLFFVACAKKKIPASEVYIGNLTVEGRILATDERILALDAQIKASLDRMAEQNQEYRQRFEEHDRRIEQLRLESVDLLKALMLMAQQNEARFGRLDASAGA
jgi:hypothetical protein